MEEQFKIKNSIRISIGDAMLISHWMETYRNPDKQPQFITIETIDTGVGQAIRAFIETKKGEGVWKDFTDYNSW